MKPELQLLYEHILSDRKPLTFLVKFPRNLYPTFYHLLPDLPYIDSWILRHSFLMVSRLLRIRELKSLRATCKTIKTLLDEKFVSFSISSSSSSVGLMKFSSSCKIFSVTYKMQLPAFAWTSVFIRRNLSMDLPLSLRSLTIESAEATPAFFPNFDMLRCLTFLSVRNIYVKQVAPLTSLKELVVRDPDSATAFS